MNEGEPDSPVLLLFGEGESYSLYMEQCMDSFIGKEKELFDYMRQNGFPVYHLSNFFYRDIQYAIRDFIRDHSGKDIGSRKMERLAEEFVADLEGRNILRPQAANTWVLFDERYRLPSEKEKEVSAAAETDAAEPATAVS